MIVRPVQHRDFIEAHALLVQFQDALGEEGGLLLFVDSGTSAGRIGYDVRTGASSWGTGARWRGWRHSRPLAPRVRCVVGLDLEDLRRRVALGKVGMLAKFAPRHE